MIDLETRTTSTSHDWIEEMDVNISFDFGTEILRWSPKSTAETTKQSIGFGAKMGLSATGIGVDIGMTYDVSGVIEDIEVNDSTDTILNNFNMNYVYSGNANDPTTVTQHNVVLVKDKYATYDIDVDYQINARFRHYTFLFFSSTLNVSDTYHKDVTPLELNDFSNIYLTDEITHEENVTLAYNERRRLVINALYTGRILVQVNKWNENYSLYSEPNISLYNGYGNLIDFDLETGYGYSEYMMINAVENNRYFIEFSTNYYTALDCNFTYKIEYLDINQPISFWDTGGIYSEEFIHYPDNPQMINVMAGSAETFLIQTSAHSNYSGYTDTVLIVYDQYGNRYSYDNNSGTGSYSLISGVSFANMYDFINDTYSEHKMIVMVRGASFLYESLGYHITIED